MGYNYTIRLRGAIWESSAYLISLRSIIHSILNVFLPVVRTVANAILSLLLLRLKQLEGGQGHNYKLTMDLEGISPILRI